MFFCRVNVTHLITNKKRINMEKREFLLSILK